MNGKDRKNNMKKTDERRKWLSFLFVLLTLATVTIVLFFYTCQTTIKVKTPAEFPITTTTETTTTTTTTTTTITTTTTTTTTTLPIDYTMHIDMTTVKQHKANSPKVVGWIYIPDTAVDYPIMQADDNNYFLHLDWMERESFAGCIYEDYRGNLDNTTLTLLYGHNMAAGTMFSNIKYYKDPAWGKKHPYFEVASLEKRYLYEVLSANVLNGESGAAFSYWLPNKSLTMNEKEYKEYLQQIKKTATVWYGKDDVSDYTGNIIALQTCNSGSDDGMRCVIFARCLGER